MIGWIIGGLISYNIIGFIYALTMLTIIISEDKNDLEGEFDSGGARIMFILTCTTCWIILIPITITYRLYRKIKGGNKNGNESN